MIFEMTLDYTVIIPMTITVALSYGVREALQRQSIYTLKLARAGARHPRCAPGQLATHRKKVRDIMDTHFVDRAGRRPRLDDFADGRRSGRRFPVSFIPAIRRGLFDAGIGAAAAQGRRSACRLGGTG